jgi:hypothetical protein
MISTLKTINMTMRITVDIATILMIISDFFFFIFAILKSLLNEITRYRDEIIIANVVGNTMILFIKCSPSERKNSMFKTVNKT